MLKELFSAFAEVWITCSFIIGSYVFGGMLFAGGKLLLIEYLKWDLKNKKAKKKGI